MNILKSPESVILLNLINVIYHKAKQIEQGSITIIMDNESVQKILNRAIKIANHYNQDAAAEYGVITQLIENTPVNVIIDRVNSH